MKPYQALPRHVAYALQEPYEKEMERLLEHQIMVSLEVQKQLNGITAVS